MLYTLLLSTTLVLAVSGGAIQLQDSPICELCKEGVTELKVIWSDPDTQALLKLGQAFLCANVPIENCEDWVTSELEKVDEIITKMSPTETCTQAAMCGKLGREGDSMECEFCEFMGKEAKQLLLSNTTIDEVISVVEGICDEIPISLISNECHALVAEYGDYYLHLLAQDFDVEQVCRSLGLCSADVRHMVEATELYQVVMGRLRMPEDCEECKDVFALIQSTLSSDDTKDMLHVAVKKVCGVISLPGCETIGDSLIDELLAAVIPLLDPVTRCTAIGACTNSTVPMELITAAKPHVVKDDEECEACKDGFDLIKEVLSSNDTKDMLHVAVKEACTLIPITGCEAIGNALVDELLAALLPMLDPTSICTEIGACNSTVMMELVVGGDSPKCEACKDGLGEIRKAANDPATNQIVKDLGTFICSKISIPFCEDILDKLLDENLEKLQKIDVNGTCVSWGACTAAVEVTATQNVGDECSECKMVAGAILSVLENGSIDNLIKEAIGEICGVIPIPSCKTTLDGLFDELITLLKNMDSATICTLIGLC